MHTVTILQAVAGRPLRGKSDTLRCGRFCQVRQPNQGAEMFHERVDIRQNPPRSGDSSMSMIAREMVEYRYLAHGFNSNTMPNSAALSCQAMVRGALRQL